MYPFNAAICRSDKHFSVPVEDELEYLDGFSGAVEILTSGSESFFDCKVETLRPVMHNLVAFTSPVSEAVARGEDSWP